VAVRSTAEQQSSSHHPTPDFRLLLVLPMASAPITVYHGFRTYVLAASEAWDWTSTAPPGSTTPGSPCPNPTRSEICWLSGGLATSFQPLPAVVLGLDLHPLQLTLQHPLRQELGRPH